MLPGLPFANIAHLGWAVKDIDHDHQELRGHGPGTVAPLHLGGRRWRPRFRLPGIRRRHGQPVQSRLGQVGDGRRRTVRTDLLPHRRELPEEPRRRHLALRIFGEQAAVRSRRLPRWRRRASASSAARNTRTASAWLSSIPTRPAASSSSCTTARRKWKTSSTPWGSWCDETATAPLRHQCQRSAAGDRVVRTGPRDSSSSAKWTWALWASRSPSSAAATSR